MKAKDIMTRDIFVVSPDTSIQEAAQAMQQQDIGALPVCDGEKILGMVTDRDIAVRGVAKGLHAQTAVGAIMTTDVSFCLVDDDLDEVREMMSKKQIRRLPVIDDKRNLAGMISLGDIALRDRDREAGETLENISRPN
jgi:CBS domain-containing protein